MIVLLSNNYSYFYDHLDSDTLSKFVIHLMMTTISFGMFHGTNVIHLMVPTMTICRLPWNRTPWIHRFDGAHHVRDGTNVPWYRLFVPSWTWWAPSKWWIQGVLFHGTIWSVPWYGHPGSIKWVIVSPAVVIQYHFLLNWPSKNMKDQYTIILLDR